MSTKTLTVQRANVVLDIPEYQLDYYMNQGYNQIDEYGNVIKASVPTSVGTLQKAYVEHIKKIEDLESEIESLQAEIAKLKSRKRQK